MPKYLYPFDTMYLGLYLIYISAAFFTLFILRKLRKILILRNIPSPKCMPVLGFTIEFLQDNEVTLFNKIRKYAKEFSGIYRFSFLHIDVVNIYNSEDIEQILSSYDHLTKSDIYNLLDNWLGTGLLTSKGEKWRTRRKMLTPTFHFQILQEFLKCFNEETNKFVKYIAGNIDECTQDIKPMIIFFTMKNICETAMGLEEIDETSFSNYQTNVSKIKSLIFEKLQRIWYKYTFIYRFSNMALKEKVLLEILHNFSYTVIRNRIKMREENSVKRKRLAMLDLLLKFKEDGGDIDLEGIREEVDTFIFEGHDTTAAAIQYILLLLANHPHIQEKAAEEVDRIFKGEFRDCTQEDLSKLEYLECCIKESLRLFPSVPFVSRECGKDYTTSTGYRIPKGTIVHMHVFDLHRDEKVFPNPKKFDPDRFKTENAVNRSPFAYIPFSAGPRNCIGQRFAMWELKTLLCGILRNFRLKAIDTPEDMIFKCDLILTTVNPIKIKFLRK